MMRDFIWILILLWTLFQLSSLFGKRKKSGSADRLFKFNSKTPQRRQTSTESIRKASDREGEYVDFEELK